MRKGLPFRQAHGVVAQLTRFAEDRGARFEDLSLEDYRSFSPLFDEDVLTHDGGHGIGVAQRAGRDRAVAGGRGAAPRAGAAGNVVGLTAP